MKHISDEQFLDMKGWKKKIAYRLSQEDIDSFQGREDVYFDDPLDLLVKEEVWFFPHYELYYTDAERLIEDYYEEYLDENGDLYDEPVQNLTEPKLSED